MSRAAGVHAVPDREIPDKFRCGIDGRLMSQPMRFTASDGQVFYYTFT